eukprot:Sdes_comp20390_c0_seq1m14314
MVAEYCWLTQKFHQGRKISLKTSLLLNAIRTGPCFTAFPKGAVLNRICDLKFSHHDSAPDFLYVATNAGEIFAANLVHVSESGASEKPLRWICPQTGDFVPWADYKMAFSEKSAQFIVRSTSNLSLAIFDFHRQSSFQEIPLPASGRLTMPAYLELDDAIVICEPRKIIVQDVRTPSRENQYSWTCDIDHKEYGLNESIECIKSSNCHILLSDPRGAYIYDLRTRKSDPIYSAMRDSAEQDVIFSSSKTLTKTCPPSKRRKFPLSQSPNSAVSSSYTSWQFPSADPSLHLSASMRFLDENLEEKTYFDPDQKRYVSQFSGHHFKVLGAISTQNRRHVLTTDEMGIHKLWNTSTGQGVYTYSPGNTAGGRDAKVSVIKSTCVFSPDQESFFSLKSQQEIGWWTLYPQSHYHIGNLDASACGNTAEIFKKPFPGFINDMALSTHGEHFAILLDNNSVMFKSAAYRFSSGTH